MVKHAPAFHDLLPEDRLSIYEALPDIRDQVALSEIYQALMDKGPLQLLQLCAVTTGPLLEKKHCKRLLTVMKENNLVFNRRRYWIARNY